MKKTNLNTKRLEFLNNAKNQLIIDGWNDNIFKTIAKEGRYKEEEIKVLFDKGYKSLLKLYLFYADEEMIKACKNIDLIRMKTHERIREIILLRLKINDKDRKLVKRTFFTLMLPQHTKIAASSLYNSVNKIWYLAGDHSTNFNYYTKRAILASVYSSTVFYWMNENKTLEQTKDFLNDHLKKVSKIPKIKERVDSIVNMFPQIFSFAKTFSRFKR